MGQAHAGEYRCVRGARRAQSLSLEDVGSVSSRKQNLTPVLRRPSGRNSVEKKKEKTVSLLRQKVERKREKTARPLTRDGIIFSLNGLYDMFQAHLRQPIQFSSQVIMGSSMVSLQMGNVSPIHDRSLPYMWCNTISSYIVLQRYSSGVVFYMSIERLTV